MSSLVLRLAVSLWLAYLAVADLRCGVVSNWATVPPLLAVVAWRVGTGGWSVGVALALVLIVAQWPRLWPPVLAGAVVCLAGAVPQGVDVTALAWFALVPLWLLDVLGGADVKAVMTLTALFPDLRLAWLLTLALLAWSLFHLARLRGRETPRALLSTIGAALRLRRPDEVHTCAGLPAVALGGLLYVWFYL